MKQIADYVRDIINHDLTTLSYLHKGILNTRAYAKSIIPRIEESSLLKPSLASVVTALSRIKKDTSTKDLILKKFIIKNIEVRLPISELVYRKTPDTFHTISQLYNHLSQEQKANLNIINVGYELDIFAGSELKTLIQNHFSSRDCIEIRDNLAMILLEYNPMYRQHYGMAAQILMTLANYRINMLECVTTYSEMVIYIDQIQAQIALEVLKRDYVNSYTEENN